MPSPNPTPDLPTILLNLADLLHHNPQLPNEISEICTTRAELARLKQEKQEMLAEHQEHERQWEKVFEETQSIASDRMMAIIKAVSDAIRNDASKEADLEGKLEEKKQEMAAQLKAKDTEIAGMQAAHKNQLEGLKQQQKSSIEKVVKERDDAVLQFAARREVIQRTQEELKETKELLSAEHIHRKKAEAKLAGIQQEVGVQDLVETAFATQAQALETRIYTLSKDLFHPLTFPTSSADTLRTQLLRSGFLTPSEADSDFPLFLTNTPWSKCLLMALAENTISTILTDRLFRVLTLPPDTQKKTLDHLELISKTLTKLNPANEARWRSLATSALEADGVFARVVDSCLKKLTDTFAPLFSGAPERSSELAARLVDILNDAASLWKSALHSDRRIVADLAELSGLRAAHEEHFDVVVPEDEFAGDEMASEKPFPLFPRFLVQGAAGRRREVFAGLALEPGAGSAVRSRAERKRRRRAQAEIGRRKKEMALSPPASPSESSGGEGGYVRVRRSEKGERA